MRAGTASRNVCGGIARTAHRPLALLSILSPSGLRTSAGFAKGKTLRKASGRCVSCGESVVEKVTVPRIEHRPTKW